MIKKGKISGFQMILIMHPTIMASGLVLTPSITAIYAKQDMWISPILASVIGYFIVYLVYELNKIYPNETIIEYSKHIIGLIPGKIIGFIFLIFYLHVNGMIIREYGEFIQSSFLPKTPLAVILGSMVLLCSFAVRGGLEVIARCAEIVEQFLFISLVLLLMLLIPDWEFKNMLPVMEHGILPVIKGAIISTNFYSQFMLLAFFLPFLIDQDKGIKWGFYAVHLVVPTFILFNIVPLLLLGTNTANSVYPVMRAVKYISISNFFENVDAVLVSIFVGGVFIKISMFFYAVTLGTAQWLNLSDYRPIVFPIGVLLVLFSIWSATDMQELAHFFTATNPFYMLSIQMLIPLSLLVIALLRKKNQ